MGLVSELRRRNVFRMAVLYVVAAWLIMQVAEVIIGLAGLQDWIGKTTLVLLAIGFPIALIFSWFYELTPEGISLEKDVEPGESITHITGRRLDFIVIALLSAGLLLFAWDKWWIGSPPDKSIAVLPFENMSGDPEQKYFSDGISEEILNALASVPDLKVAGRTSSFAFSGQHQDLRAIGDVLSVAHILDGSVRRSGNRLRITAELIKVKDGYRLWSDSYDRELTDVFAIQDEIAGAIIRQLKAQLLADSRTTAVTAYTDPDVYDLYLLAKRRISERDQHSLESAAELLDQALALDPDFAPAYAQRGITWLLLSEDLYGAVPKSTALAQGRLNLDRALQLDPNLAEALAGLGLYYHDVPRSTALRIQYLEKALAINPNLTDASTWLQFAYRDAGQWQKALGILEKTIERDPLFGLGIANIAWVYIQMGQQDKSRKLLDSTKSLRLEYSSIALEVEIQFSLGRFADGLMLAESIPQLTANHREERRVMGFGLCATHQYRRCVEEGNAYHSIFALWHLGRLEEASTLAYDTASKGISATPLFIFLNANDRSEELIEYLEDRWPDLEDFEEDFVSRWPWQMPPLNEIALAYSRTGNQEKFDEVTARTKARHDKMRAEGLDNYFFSLNQAIFFAIAGDHDTALQHLAASIDAGYIGSNPLALKWPALEALESDPRYELIQARMIEHLNAEREKLGLRPVSE